MNGDTENNRRFCSLTRAGRRARMRDLSPPRATSISCMDQRLLLFNFFLKLSTTGALPSVTIWAKSGVLKKANTMKKTHTQKSHNERAVCRVIVVAKERVDTARGERTAITNSTIDQIRKKKTRARKVCSQFSRENSKCKIWANQLLCQLSQTEEPNSSIFVQISTRLMKRFFSYRRFDFTNIIRIL